MPKSINTDQSETHLVQSVPLDGQGYQFEFVWRERTYLWYLSIRMDDGSPIVEQKAIQPGVSFLKGHAIDKGPPGELMVIGPSDYRKEDLSENLLLIYFSEDELFPKDVDRPYIVY